MGAISGVLGAVNGVPGVRDWEITYAGNPVEFSTSGTENAKTRIIGNTDWTGRYAAYGHTPFVMPGEALAFIGAVEEGTSKEGASGAAICEEVSIVWDIEGGRPIENMVTFGGNGALTLDAVTVAAGTDAVFPSIGCILEASAVLVTPSYAEIADIRTMTLTIRRELKSYASSGTAGIMQRVAGNVDLEFSFSCYCSAFDSAVLPCNVARMLRPYVTDVLYWDISAVLFGDAGGIGADREGAELVSPTLSGGFQGTQYAAGVPTSGFIKKPGAVSWWPPA